MIMATTMQLLNSLSKYGGNSTSSHAMSGGPGNSNGTLYKLSVK